MRSRNLVAALVVLSLGVFAGTVAPAAWAVDPYVVDVQECARNNGQATVPAGAPISVQNFAFVTGTYGLMQNFLLKQETMQGVARPAGGTPTLVDVTDEWSNPEQIGDGPAQGWVTRLPNIELEALAAGEVVGVGSLTEFTGPIQIVFTPVGLIGFGPFHVAAGDVFLQVCEITAV
ncbi:MAG TPA: hypothetical protein VFO26_11790 [Gaiella sp.]|uniref:hypothetical protein n=1 Tax=Gaiella sp. TaxID=2663207 RepID=UPI002D7E6757|nr:hypothetical protein [Gaiella sp.]HET9288226.1 hypothetical protein [Gaiella sp.]